MVSSAAYLVLTIVGFGMLILIHEAGHFLMAKRARIRAHHFAVGFGPVVASFRPGIGFKIGSTEAATMAALRAALPEATLPDHVNAVPRALLNRAGLGETQYELRVLPLGGFVGMAGQDDSAPGARSEEEGSFNRASLPARVWVISGGVIANLILGVVLFGIAFWHGVEFEAPTLGPISPGTPAAEGGLRAGDTIMSIDGSPIETFTDCRIATALGGDGAPLNVVVRRPMSDGGNETLALSVTPKDAGTGIRQIGIRPSTSLVIDPGALRAAQRAALIATVPALAPSLGGISPVQITEAGGDAVATWAMLDRAFERSLGKPVEIKARAGDESIIAAVQPLPPLPLVGIASGPDVIPTPEYSLAGLSPLTMIGDVLPDSSAAGKLEPHDLVLRLDGVAGPLRQDFREAVKSARNRTVTCVIERQGEQHEVTLSVPGSGVIGVHLQLAMADNRVARPSALWSDPSSATAQPLPTPAAVAGVAPLSRIVSVRGEAVVPAEAWKVLATRARQAVAGADPGAAVDFQLALAAPTGTGVPEQLHVTFEGWSLIAERDATWGNPFPPDLFRPNQVILSAAGHPIQAVTMGFRQTGAILTNVFLTLRGLFRGDVGVNQLSGPIGIVHAGTVAAERSAWYLIFFLALISINLAFLNALPIPIADGGHMVYLLWEAITGKMPSPRFQNAAALVGLVFFVGLFLLTFYNDVLRLLS